MPLEESSQESTGRQPISPGTRRRLQQCFEHGTRNMGKGDHDYANDMFTQCVVGDPGNLIYAQTFLGNLQKKYNNNKKGGKLASLKGAGAKAAIKKATGKSDWAGVVKAGCDMLKLNPWDVTALTAMAHTAEELEHDEIQLFYLKMALDTNSKDPDLNRLSALALARMGQFDQAIACWHRVELAKPDDQDVKRAIADLTVEKTIHRGHYEQKASGEEKTFENAPVAEKAPKVPSIPPKQRLQEAIAENPEEVSNYLELAELHNQDDELAEAEKVLSTALEASGGDLMVRERLEDLQFEQGRKQVAVADQRAKQQRTEEAITLAKKVRAEVNRIEQQIFAARSERTPEDLGLHYELGLRLKRSGMFNEAIQSLQCAREDEAHKAKVFLELGECFQHIKRFKLAMTNYQSAIEASAKSDEETRKLALYRAGVLAMGLKEWDEAEKHLNDLAGLDFGYKDVAERLDKIAEKRNNE